MSKDWLYISPSGRLGNCLCQIAAGYTYCRKYDLDLYVNENYLRHRGVWEHLNLKDSKVTIKPLGEKRVPQYFRFNTFCKALPPGLKNCGIYSYCQNEALWSEYADEVHQLLAGFVDPKKEEGSVGVHYRMGDYVDDGYAHSKYAVINPNFILEALKYCDNRKALHIFSDSPKRAEERLSGIMPQLKAQFETVDLDCVGRDQFLTFRKLTTCEEIVASASTYSMWAAYLGKAKRTIFMNSHHMFPIDGTSFVNSEQPFGKTCLLVSDPVLGMKPEATNNNLRVGVVGMFIGKYKCFFPGWYENQLTYLFPGMQKTFFVYTDDPELSYVGVDPASFNRVYVKREKNTAEIWRAKWRYLIDACLRAMEAGLNYLVFAQSNVRWSDFHIGSTLLRSTDASQNKLVGFLLHPMNEFIKVQASLLYGYIPAFRKFATSYDAFLNNPDTWAKACKLRQYDEFMLWQHIAKMFGNGKSLHGVALLKPLDGYYTLDKNDKNLIPPGRDWLRS